MAISGATRKIFIVKVQLIQDEMLRLDIDYVFHVK
jgi:hypothetical protein